MGLENRHRERDLALPKQRETLLNTIKKDLLNDENVLGVFLGGSIANNNTDLYSDIDLRIVVKDDLYEKYRQNKKERANNWGNVYYFEDFPWTNYSVAHYNTFIKVDTFYYKVKDVQPSVWLQNIKILYDTDHFLHNIVEQSSQLSYSPTIEEFEIWRTKFFAYVHEAYRRAMRKELYYALNCLDHIRLSIITGWYMDANIQPNTFGDWSKLEGNRSKLHDWQLHLLSQWHSGRAPAEILFVIKEIVLEFLKVHKSLCNKLGIKENLKWVDEILSLVL